MNTINILFLVITVVLFKSDDICHAKALTVFFKTEKYKVTTSTPGTTTASNLANDDLKTIEDTVDFLRQNGYNLLEEDIEKTVKFEKFQSMKTFNENKAIQNTIKYDESILIFKKPFELKFH